MNALKAFFLVGPTASGKTAVSQWIAENYSCEILSADSMMVYRGMDIGTAKPEPALRGRVRYWGVDLAELHEHFSAGMYRAHALQAIEQAAASGHKTIVTGGTGLYIKSLTHGLEQGPGKIDEIRTRAAELMRQGGVSALQSWAMAQAPVQYQALADKENPRRIIRALELARLSPEIHKTSWKTAGKGGKLAGLLLSKDCLAGWIMTRVKNMYANGLLAEVENLMRQGLETAPTAARAIGYSEAIGFLRKKYSMDEAMELTARRTRQLAKRQMTWFRHQADVEWISVDAGMKTDQIGRLVMACWEKFGPTAIAE